MGWFAYVFVEPVKITKTTTTADNNWFGENLIYRLSPAPKSKCETYMTINCHDMASE